MDHTQIGQQIIDSVAQSVRESSDISVIINRTLETIHTHLHTSVTCFHVVDDTRKSYRLLGIHSTCDDDVLAQRLHTLSEHVCPFNEWPRNRQQPLVVADVQADMRAERGEKWRFWDHKQIQSIIFIPLWFGNHYEGMLTAAFASGLPQETTLLSALTAAGTYIAAALVQARMKLTIQSEQTSLYTILDQIPEGALIADAISGSIRYANEAAASLLQTSLAQLIGLPVHQFTRQPVPEHMVQGVLPPWNFFLIQALSGEIIRSKEATLVTPDGQRIVVLISCAPISVKHEKQQILTGAIILFQDITKTKNIEQHKNEFLSIASHELRTPITIIQGFADLLAHVPLEASSLNELTQSALMHIVDQSEYLTRLIDAMLDITRIEQQQLHLDRGLHDLHHLLRQVVDSQVMTTSRHQIYLTVEGLHEQEPLLGVFDKERIIQVISNLINNAVKYSPDGGEIEVGLRVVPIDRRSEKHREAWMWVKDQGMGIAPDECSRIFERFYRARVTNNSSLSGFGIGLYVTREIINRHGGRVWVESKLHEGSTFFIHLPLYASSHIVTEAAD
ncbi:ATP-binding protein [Dictyobacter aurantiacus]|uniref:histidine kinase n=1 Tax=Dictyobacter aurantiacus TaxID=1936993 RepID=A0A401Z8R0_9CHLR|nr:ATP-binding protein [Dictyobacter aurantiacus]GCE03257.1 hypothetical protein KDAU_05860 [Dictyobacter aurantiacus]